MRWYADALGAAALAGVDVFCRETLSGDWLESIFSWQGNQTTLYAPHPDFWVAALWRLTMGVQVKRAVVQPATVALRAYASGNGTSTTLLLISLEADSVLQVQLPVHATATVFELTAPTPDADWAALNGQPLRIASPQDPLPALTGKPLPAGLPLALSPKGIAFVVLPSSD
jgi:hypothetical protein